LNRFEGRHPPRRRRERGELVVGTGSPSFWLGTQDQMLATRWSSPTTTVSGWSYVPHFWDTPGTCMPTVTGTCWRCVSLSPVRGGCERLCPSYSRLLGGWVHVTRTSAHRGRGPGRPGLWELRGSLGPVGGSRGREQAARLGTFVGCVRQADGRRVHPERGLVMPWPKPTGRRARSEYC